MRAMTIVLACVCSVASAATPPAKAPKEEGAGLFSGCSGQQGDDATFLSCGNILATTVDIKEPLKPDDIETNLQAFEGQFPPSAKRTRDTVTIGGKALTRAVVTGEKDAFRAQMVVAPPAGGVTRVTTCARKGPASGAEKCDAMIASLVTNGPPKGERVPPPPPPTRPPTPE